MKRLAIILVLLCGCADNSEPETVSTVEVKTSAPITPPKPIPIPVRECEVTKITIIKDCKLYDLLCDDGSTDMVFLCPITYWELEPYIPLPR